MQAKKKNIYIYLNNKTIKLLYKNRNKINNKIKTINKSDGEQLKKVCLVYLCSPYTCTQITYNIPQTYTPAKHEQQSHQIIIQVIIMKTVRN